jgi:hypothetical protein
VDGNAKTSVLEERLNPAWRNEMKGRNISVLIGHLLLGIAAQAQTIPVTVPAGTRLRVKLETPVNTKTAHAGDDVKATLIETISLRGEVALPAGTHVSGRITEVDVAGDERAAVRLAFDTVMLPDGRTFAASPSLSPSFRSPTFWMAAKLIGVLLALPVVGASIGAAAGGREGAAQGAGTGGVIALLGVIALSGLKHSTPVDRWENLKLKRGRKMWLRLDADLTLAPPAPPAARSEK